MYQGGSDESGRFRNKNDSAFPPLIDQCANRPLIEPYTQIIAEVIKELDANEGR